MTFPFILHEVKNGMKFFYRVLFMTLGLGLRRYWSNTGVNEQHIEQMLIYLFYALPDC